MRYFRQINIKEYGITDFSCFSHAHFKLFLKNLRRQLKYHYGNSDFKYFLTSEYGTDERYTHRPHYHIMFYITNGINPLTFSKLVSKCWSYGRTDGLPYKTLKYVAGHIYGYDLGFGRNTDIKCVKAVCTYVSKYITKSSKFAKKLEKRINLLRSRIDDEDTIKSLIRNIDMFHRQSQEFGLSYIYSMDDREITALFDGNALIEDSKKVIRTFPLPLYYKRKLFYELKKRDDKTYYWELHDNGIHYKNQLMLKTIDVQKKNIQDLLLNVNVELQNRFYELLAGRTIEDYLIYTNFYSGRIRQHKELSLDNPVSHAELTDEEYNLYDWLKCINSSFKVNSKHYSVTYIVDDDKVNVTNDKAFFSNFQYLAQNDEHIFDKAKFFEMVTFNENSCPEFKNFDKITELIDYSQHSKKENKQLLFDYKEDLKERLKRLKQ